MPIKKKFSAVLILLSFASAFFAFGGESMPWDSELDKFLNFLSRPIAIHIGSFLFLVGLLGILFSESQIIKTVFWVVVVLGSVLGAAFRLSHLSDVGIVVIVVILGRILFIDGGLGVASSESQATEKASWGGILLVTVLGAASMLSRCFGV